jgi:phosphoglycerol transferase
MGERARTIAAGAAAAALSLALAVALFDVGLADLADPLWYEGDALFGLALVKGLLDHGTVLRNPDLGAPHGLEFHDFLNPYWLHFATLSGIGWFTDEPGTAVNVLWLLGFPAISVGAFAGLRLLGLPRAESAAGAVLYCFLPYHLVRGTKHLFLSMYYLVPLAAALAVRLHRDAPALAGPRRGDLRPRVGIRAAVLTAALALALGASGAYYAYFGCFFFAVAGVLGSLRARSAAPLTAGALLCALVVASAAAGLAPSLRYWHEHGRNPAVAHRVAAEAERQGLKIAPLLLPVPRHPIPGWGELRERYDKRTPLRGESHTATLGLAIGMGFLILVGWALARVGGLRAEPSLLDSLAALQLAGLLLATTSGFGALVARFGFRAIRAYNRISVWLAFFALAALIAAAQPLRRRLLRTRGGAVAGALALALGLALALADLVSPASLPDRAAVRRKVAMDRAFVQRAEALLPAGAIVFQLPHVDHPEVTPTQRMQSYDALRPYLHARRLRFGHGAMKGRPAGDAIAALAATPAESLPRVLAAAGYAAILVDRGGYDLAGEAALRRALRMQLGPPALTSENGRFLLYPLPAGDAGP